ncbi:lytic transglycosylase [Pseudoruegeria sp. HB172150]|uniref:transglycosylase SLT domain-containing protein n=1 Tax=Pseudoruegeria sp. HB172150 TaxID=2721164 RepID=UPI0020A67596|nr:lytic transglycosylase [Pseudoruegeria sp. HB172150]
MRRLAPVAAILAAAALAGCSSSSDKIAPPPADPENACAVLLERPHYYKALTASRDRWGVPMNVQMAMIFQESTFRSNIRPPRGKSFGFFPGERPSSAYGYAQALDGAWGDYLKGPARNGATRDNIFDATDFMGWYVSEANASLGISNSDAKRSYLAYHEGRTGYRRGSHKKKSWLLQVSDGVAARAAKYDDQLTACGA